MTLAKENKTVGTGGDNRTLAESVNTVLINSDLSTK